MCNPKGREFKQVWSRNRSYFGDLGVFFCEMAQLASLVVPLVF
jgi:hypothetical protein